jgi:hypothetical protein
LFESIDGRTVSELVVGDETALSANRRAALPDGWAHLPMTPRANAEPTLNRWLGELLGPADQIAAIVTPEGSAAVEVTASDLAVQPLDLLAILGPGIADGERELGTRVLHTVTRAVADPSLAPKLMLELRGRDPAWGPDRKTFYEVAPLLGAVQRVLAAAHFAGPGDLALEEQNDPNVALPKADVPELLARARNGLAQLERLVRDFITHLRGGLAPTDVEMSTLEIAALLTQAEPFLGDSDALWAARAASSALLLRAAEFGVPFALPVVDFETPSQVTERMASRLRSTASVLVERWRALGPELSGPASEAEPLLQKLRALFGGSFFPLPSFEPLATTAATPAPSGVASGIDDWFEGVAAARERVRWLERALVVADAFGRAALPFRVVQLPHVAGDAWLGTTLPDHHVPSSDKLSLVVLGAGLDAPRASGIVVDQWHELIPDRKLTTGITFHYEQPDAMPPQAVLLAVSPRLTGRWRWDDLVHTLDETLDLAMNRMVELEHLSGEIYGQLLPAVTGEVVPNFMKDAAGEVPGSRVILDFGVNNIGAS